MTRQAKRVGTVGSVTIDDLDKNGKEVLPMILDLATKYHRADSPITHEQLVSAGLLGLMQAQAGWNRKSNTLLSTYAYHHVRGRMLDLLAAERKYHTRFEVTDPVDMLDMRTDVNGAEEAVIRASVLARVQTIIRREFTDRQKQVLSWYLAGHSNEAVAEHLCVPVSEIDAALEAALNKLRVRLGVKK